VDIFIQDTYFIVAHIHYVVFGGSIFGAFAAIYFWFPKMFGRSMNEFLGKAHFWLTFIPFFAVFFMQHFQGLQGMPRRYYAFTTYEFLKQTQGQNVLISVAALAWRW